MHPGFHHAPTQGEAACQARMRPNQAPHSPRCSAGAARRSPQQGERQAPNLRTRPRREAHPNREAATPPTAPPRAPFRNSRSSCSSRSVRQNRRRGCGPVPASAFAETLATSAKATKISAATTPASEAIARRSTVAKTSAIPVNCAVPSTRANPHDADESTNNTGSHTVFQSGTAARLCSRSPVYAITTSEQTHKATSSATNMRHDIRRTKPPQTSVEGHRQHHTEEKRIGTDHQVRGMRLRDQQKQPVGVSQVNRKKNYAQHERPRAAHIRRREEPPIFARNDQVSEHAAAYAVRVVHAAHTRWRRHKTAARNQQTAHRKQKARARTRAAQKQVAHNRRPEHLRRPFPASRFLYLAFRWLASRVASSAANSPHAPPAASRSPTCRKRTAHGFSFVRIILRQYVPIVRETAGKRTCFSPIPPIRRRRCGQRDRRSRYPTAISTLFPLKATPYL